MDMLADCKRKLRSFRVKELKDVLVQLGVPNQGRRKQDLLERIINILYPVEALGRHGWVNMNLIGKHVAKIIDDVYRKMQGASATGSTSGYSDISSTSKQVRCPCGDSLPSEFMIQCSDPECQVLQHKHCVTNPEESTEGVHFPPNFYCELCRISRCDPFLLTVAQPLPPVKLIVAGARPMQHVKKVFEITTEHSRLLEDTDCEAQVWCVLLNDSITFRMHWLLYADLRINGTPVRTASRHVSQKLGVNGRDEGLLIPLTMLKGFNKFFLRVSDARSFCLGIRIVRPRTIPQVINLIPSEQEGEPLSEALARVCRCIGGGIDTNKDGDSELKVIANCVTVNLRCPISGSRIKTASRFRPCTHLGCFDLHTFLQLNQKSKKWQCPICLKNFSFKDIIIDPFFQSYHKNVLNIFVDKMREYDDDITEIDVKHDGSWCVKSGLRFVNRQQWHLPDGSICLGRRNKPTSGTRNNNSMQTQASRNQQEECPGTSASVGDSTVIIISDSNEDNDNQGAAPFGGPRKRLRVSRK